MKDRAYAKINLCLDVVRRMENGYHELKMIMVPIDFYDVLEMNFANETSLRIEHSSLPVNEKNTILKTIRYMQEKYHISQEFECILSKHIPTQAGLAGGSADAASAIRMINKLCRLNLSREEMIAVGKEIGADVPFCIVNKPSFVGGIGEQLTPFQCRAPFEVLLVKPKRGVSTKSAFEGLNFDTIVHPDCDAMQKALEEGNYTGVINNLGNSLEDISLKLVPQIEIVKQELTDRGFDGVLMSGSGSTVFGITQDVDLVQTTMREMKKKGYFVRHTRILEK